MGIDYLIDYDCPIKREYGIDRIMTLQKNVNRIENLTQLIQNEDPNKNVDEVVFEMQLHTPEGIVTTEAKVSDVKKETEPFKEKLKGCLQCPVNVKTPFSPPDGGFGCFQSINYPIDKASEFFLIKTVEKLARDPEKNKVANTVFKIINDHKEVGKEIEKMRKNEMKIPFFTSAEAFTYTIGKGPNGIYIDTNQIWDLLSVPKMSPQYSYIMFNFLEEFAEEIMKDERTRQSQTILGLIILNNVLRSALQNKVEIISSR
jgi:hypothetical protein